jgi:hypothetical protein
MWWIDALEYSVRSSGFGRAITYKISEFSVKLISGSLGENPKEGWGTRLLSVFLLFIFM